MKRLNLEYQIIDDINNMESEEAISYIKERMYNVIHQWDNSASIIGTSFFNHSYNPDLVLNWGKNVSRYVYFRTTSSVRSIMRDSDFLSEFRPIFITINGIDFDSAIDDEVRCEIKHQGAFVSSLNAVDAINDAATRKPAVRLISRPIARNGEGLVGAADMVDAADSFLTGIDGAKSLQVAPVRDAINDFSCFMNEYGVGSVAAFLHLLWVGNGGDESLFPFSLSSKAILDDEAWNYLLSIENLNDQTFWDNLNVDISLQQLIRLNVREYPDAFNRLMRSKASSTKVKAVKLVKTQSSFNNDDSGVWKWGVDLGRLCIYCRQWVAYFSIDVDSLDDCGDSESIMSDSGLFARDFQKLTKGKTVKRVTIENGDSVSISNIPNDNIDDSHSLKLFRKSRRNSAHVVSSSFHIDGASGGVVEVDFVNHFAYVKSRRLPSLRDLIQSTIPVLLGLNTGVSNSLDDLFSDYDPQGVLFA